jgi:hypothetical protein
MDEQQRPVERETTIIHTGERSGGGGAVAAVVALVVLAVLAFLFFGGYFEKAADDLDVNVNVGAPNVELPDVSIETPPPAQPAEPANGN